MTSERHQRLMTILADALECDTGERAFMLADACAGDETLRRDVERLLASSKSALEFLEDPVFDAGRRKGDDPVLGRSIGPYLVTTEIGRGGMGTVLLGVRNDDAYRRQVAIKIVKRGMDTDVIVRRFRRERQILATLDHQNIARLFDGGTTDDGRPYLVMEYVEGRPIQKYSDEHHLAINTRLQLFLTVCDAVEYAHRRQVIHRDLKPGNILVTNEGVPKLLDFGVAKVLYAQTENATTETTLPVLHGLTPEYASPEQLRGETPTVASDVYSLGVLLCELLTGQRPFDLSRTSAYDIAKVVDETAPEKPSVLSKRKTRATGEANGKDTAGEDQPRRRLSGELDTIVLMALRKEPERRYRSVAELAEDIRRHLAGLPIRARKDSATYRAVKFYKRHRAFVGTVAVVALICLVVGIALSRMLPTRAHVTKSIAVLPFTNLGNDPDGEYLTDGLTDSLIERFGRVPTLNVPAHNSTFRYKGREADIETIGRELGVDSVLSGRVQRTNEKELLVDVTLTDAKSRDVIWSQQYHGDSSHFLLLQNQVVRNVLAQLNVATPPGDEKRYPTDDEAYRLYLRGTYFWNRRNPEGFAKAIEYYQRAIERDPNYALGYDGLAKSYGLLGAYFIPWADNPFPKAKAAAAKALELDPDLAEAHTSMALISWLYDWDWAAAEREFKKAIELDAHYVLAHHWYGLYLGEMGNADESIAEEKRALELDPVSLPVHADLGRVYFWARRYDESLQQYNRALEMGPTFGTFYAELRYTYEQKQMYSEWFSVIDPNVDVVDANRRAYLGRDWKEFMRVASRFGLPHDRAESYIRIGDRTAALDQLELAYQTHDHRMSQLRVNPLWDELRSDPRFLELLRKMKL